MLQCAALSCQNMTSLVLEQDGLKNLGFYILAVLFLSIAISAPVTTALLKRLGLKKSLVLGGFGYVSLIFAMIFPAVKYDRPDSDSFVTDEGFIVGILVLCAVLNGFGASLVFVANGSYIAACATPKTKGFFFGFFWMTFMSS